MMVTLISSVPDIEVIDLSVKAKARAQKLYDDARRYKDEVRTRCEQWANVRANQEQHISQLQQVARSA